MSIEFYIFRHGQTDWNKKKKVQGMSDIPLNETGRGEALSLQEFFKDISIDKVFSSDLSRAYETAEIAFKNRDIPIETSRELREASFGDVEGMHIEDLLNKYPIKFWEILQDGPNSDSFSYPGGETRGEFRHRLISFINKVRKDNSLSTVVLSTHGGALRSIMHHYLPEKKELIKIPNCVVYKITFDREKLRVEGPFNNEKDLCYD